MEIGCIAMTSLNALLCYLHLHVIACSNLHFLFFCMSSVKVHVSTIAKFCHSMLLHDDDRNLPLMESASTSVYGIRVICLRSARMLAATLSMDCARRFVLRLFL